MRTTLTLDEDVAARLKHEIRRTGKTTRAVINEALKRGLGMQDRQPPAARFRVTPRAFGFKPGLDLDRLNHLADELDTEVAAARLRK